MKQWPEYSSVAAAQALGGYVVRLWFEDGLRRDLDLEPYLWGPVFEPVRDPQFFRRVRVDEESGTIAWPNGADIAPETLYHGIPVEALDETD